MRILIATGIYPPEIGGPAEYAKNLKETWTNQGHEVSVRIFSRFNFLPTGIRHLIYFCYILPAILRADFVFALDTLSAALPSVLATRMLGKQIILRTGGDFLWESYVERTGDLILLKDFYQTCIGRLSAKERKVFKLIKFVLQNVDAIVWSTEWQRNIFIEPYQLTGQQHFIVENYYGPKEGDFPAQNRTFIASSRNLVWKNLDMVKVVRDEIKSASFFLDNLPFDEFMNKIKNAYAIVLVSLGDISPNIVLDAIRLNKPFICTREVGIFDRIKDVGIFVDPLNKQEIENAVIKLLDEEEYEKWRQKVRDFSFVHTWEEMSREYLKVYDSIK